MPDFIDRDPVAIKEYSREVMKYYEDIGTLITKSNTLVQGFTDDLDDKCAELAEKYKGLVATVYKQIESYRDLAINLDRKAQALIDARDSFHF